MTRLEIHNPELAGQVREGQPDDVRKIALSAAMFAIEKTGMKDARIDAAIVALRQGRVGESIERAALRELTDGLDEEAHELQDQYEAGTTSYDVYMAASRRAAACEALWLALDRDAHKAALEALAEAENTRDLAGLRSIVREVLGVRIDALGTNLVEALRATGREALRQVACDAALFAVGTTALNDANAAAMLASLPRRDDADWNVRGAIGPALEWLRAHKFEEAPFEQSGPRDLVKVMADMLAAKAGDLKELVKEGVASEHDVGIVSGRAHAASAVWYALDSDPLRAAMEAVYEAYQATHDLETLHSIIGRAGTDK